MTAEERQQMVNAFGEGPHRAGRFEEVLAGAQVLVLLGRLFEAMENRGMTQADLARAMGVHRRQVLRWFKGDGAIRAETLVAMGRHVGLKLDAKWVALEETAVDASEFTAVQVVGRDSGLTLAMAA